jgi:hypothetical protein
MAVKQRAAAKAVAQAEETLKRVQTHLDRVASTRAVHNFLLTRPDGTTAAERFFGQKPRSMFAAILDAVEIPPAPLSPPRRAVG